MEKQLIIKLNNEYSINISSLAYIDVLRKNMQGRTWKQLFKRFKSHLLWKRNMYEYNNLEGNILFFQSPFVFRRADYIEMCKNISSTYSSFDYCNVKDGDAGIEIKRIIRNLKMCFFWNNQFREMRIDIKERIMYCYHLFQVLDLYECLDNVDVSKYKLAIVLCDAWMTDNAFVQYMQMHGIKTATLQHAQFVANPNEVENLKILATHFNNSISDYFLAWNQFTCEEAVRAGIAQDKLVLVGMPKYINNTCIKGDNAEQGYFGIMLCKEPDEANRRLIGIAEQVAKSMNIKYYIKYHPSYSGTEYSSLISEELCSGVVSRETPLSEYCNMVDFTLIVNSTVFVDLLFMEKEVYKLDIGESDIYASVMEGTFKKADDIIQRYSSTSEYEKEKEKELLFQKLCTIQRPKQEYESFFGRTNFK